MGRASGISRVGSLGMMTRIIRSRSRTVTFTRPTKTTTELGDTEETTDEHTESVWLFQPEESVSDEITGERINGSLGGLVVADIGPDIQKDDRITYGGVEYEVDTVVGHPSDDEADGSESEADFFQINFVRRNNGLNNVEY